MLRILWQKLVVVMFHLPCSAGLTGVASVLFAWLDGLRCSLVSLGDAGSEEVMVSCLRGEYWASGYVQGCSVLGRAGGPVARECA